MLLKTYNQQILMQTFHRTLLQINYPIKKKKKKATCLAFILFLNVRLGEINFLQRKRKQIWSEFIDFFVLCMMMISFNVFFILYDKRILFFKFCKPFLKSEAHFFFAVTFECDTPKTSLII